MPIVPSAMFPNSLYILSFITKESRVTAYIYYIISLNVSSVISLQSCYLCFDFKGTELQKPVAQMIQPTPNSALGRLEKT